MPSGKLVAYAPLTVCNAAENRVFQGSPVLPECRPFSTVPFLPPRPIRDGVCAGYRVHAQLVKPFVVPLAYELQIVIHYAAAERKAELRFKKLRPLDLA